ncbi:phosphatidate cytidylyltransferase [Allochromatium vinosum]|uniref:Phosphatidate cytidylyltransferase n=1 Tax=Allochromatium vinosum (strain ATCC 17899 / DSM 180 / NBRC 103801 / NCIMB 10441 / D) TaxID=572477 RepID=D3RV39_ALLVD|nr:phosphatidate cytidylyltransferase [Allochromatium vinosum]ADC62971.1 phosphatidate cytidylyltransferase [Allochromatium vinosum DSM 180]
MSDNASPASNNLRRRAQTVLWLAPLVVGAVLLLPTWAFALFLGAAMLIAAWEWCGLAGIGGQAARRFYLAFIAATLASLWHWSEASWSPLLLASLIWWLAQSLIIPRIQRIEPVDGPRPMLLITGLLILTSTWVALLSLHRIAELGPGLVLSLLILMAMADSAAYFVGRRWGRTKLAPAVSPGKTRAGAYGALAGAAFVGLLIAGWLGLAPLGVLAIAMLCILVAMLSIIGDLYESLLKRRRQLKDSSQLLPGHGGLLDRIDSLTAAAPLYALGMTWALT